MESNQPPITEARIKDLNFEIKRLSFDTKSKEISVSNFDPFTGEDLRQDPVKQLEATKNKITKAAESDMSSYLQIKESAKFSKETGEKIPEKMFDEYGKPTVDSLLARVLVFRGEIASKVKTYEEKGASIPKFDSQTGEPIPGDSLQALIHIENNLNNLTDSKDIQEGIDALMALKKGKAQVEAYRQNLGLSPNENIKPEESSQNNIQGVSGPNASAVVDIKRSG